MEDDRNLEMVLRAYRSGMDVRSREERISETVRLSGETFLKREQERMLTYGEFLRTQFLVLRKRWWAYQCLLLLAAGLLLPFLGEDVYIHRSAGVVSVLFVVLIIPEMWKNRTYNSMEIETAAYYSLRQIYAARMLLFGAADLFLAAGFGVCLRGRLHFTGEELLVQFLFPMAVTACICFGILCNKYAVSETVSIAACLVWSAVWWLFTMNEQAYKAVQFPVWMALFLAAVVFLAAAVRRTVKNCGNCLEMGGYVSWN